MSYKFELPSDNKAIIKVIGVGGGGGNAVNYMYQNGIQDVEFIVCNTDAQALKISPIPRKLVLGLQITEGLGAGTNPEVGMKAAMEDKEKIRELLVDTKMVFVTAGMGGGTGTGAAPVIARIAKEMDILTVGVVTLPFSFEGKKKLMLAEEGILQMKEHCDTVIVILNDKIREMHGNLNLKEAFSQSDVILTTAAKSIAEIITRPGFINVDFNDIHMVMSKAGAAVMGSAVASGHDRALKAAESAIHSPLLNNTDITGANKILVSITCSESNFSMDEFGEINEYFQEAAGQDALLKCGVNYDDTIGDEIRVTVIATGFAEVNQQATNYNAKSNLQVNAGRQTSIFEPSKNELPKANQKIVGKEPEMQDEQVILQASKGVFTTADERSKLILNLDGPDYETQKSEQVTSVKKTVDFQNLDTDKKKKASQDYIIRTTKISQATLFGSMSNEEHQDRFNIPAYIRKGEKLTEVPHSSERIVSRYNLNDKNELLGNNTFLHDNVD